MGVRIDEAGRDDHAVRIDRAGRLDGQMRPDRDDMVAADRDIAGERRVRAGVDSAALDQQVDTLGCGAGAQRQAGDRRGGQQFSDHAHGVPQNPGAGGSR